MKSFREKIVDFVSVIPKGKVASYGQVAAACGQPRAARQVGQILKNLDISLYKRIPWWRVINSKGEISIKGNWTADKTQQKQLLEKDGVIVSKDLKINLEKHRL